ncbi:MAG: serine hydrolase domain-containing protein [Kofleriaceae bacterium]
MSLIFVNLPISRRFAIFVLALCACHSTTGAGRAAARRGQALDRQVPELLRAYKAAGAGVAILEHGAVVWTGYYGEQGPGVLASAKTVFNSASVAKTLTAETLIALAAKQLISLDEPIARYVSDPDLSSDPRFAKLTCRLLLAHRGGLLNWPYEYKDGHAAFIAEPGTGFSYSGMGIDLAARYAEAKLGKDFEALAVEHVLAPLGISEMALGRIKPWMTGRLATPMDAAGSYFEIASSGRLADNDGHWSAADDLLSTVDAYARFLAGVIRSAHLPAAWVAERTRILSSLAGDPIWNCVAGGDVTCASHYGHGLGWMVYQFGDRTVVKHGGNDKGENALVIYSPDTGNGAVIFVNGGNGVFVSTQILGLIGDQPQIAAYYRRLVAKFYHVELPDPVRPPVRAGSS